MSVTADQTAVINDLIVDILATEKATAASKVRLNDLQLRRNELQARLAALAATSRSSISSTEVTAARHALNDITVRCNSHKAEEQEELRRRHRLEGEIAAWDTQLVASLANRDADLAQRKEVLKRIKRLHHEREAARSERIRVANLPFACEICSHEHLPVHEKFILECCNKTICRDCMRRHAVELISQGEVVIKCPMNCRDGEVPDGDLATVLDPTADRCLAQNSKRRLAESGGWTFCRFVDCPGLVHPADLGRLGTPSTAKHHFVCNLHPRNVAHQWCLNCNAPWHEGKTCEKYLEWRAQNPDANDIENEKLIQQMGWKRCPNCTAVVERKTGCNAMTCACKWSFCYLCGASAGVGEDMHAHYGIEGTRCYRQLFGGLGGVYDANV